MTKETNTPKNDGSASMSSRARVLLWVVGVALAASGYLLQAQQPPASTAAQTDRAVQPARQDAAPPIDRAVLNKYCVGCHNERRKASYGNLALDQIDTTRIGDNAQVWEKVVAKLSSGEMPPFGAPRPDAATYKATVASLEAALDRASATSPNPGRIAVHRLNRAEYANAIRDVLGLDIDAQTMLRPDETGYGFDNIANVLTISPVLMEEYKLAAWKIARLAVGDPTMRSTVTDYRLPRMLDQEYRSNEDLPFGSRGGTVIHHTFPLDGEYSLRVTLQRAYAANVIKGLTEREQIDVRVNGEQIKLFEVGGECVNSKE